MCRLIRSTQLILCAAVALLALTGCQIESDGGRFLNSSTGTGQSNDDSTSAESGSESGDLRSVSLYWSAPSHRINGDDIAIDDLGGYEVRYRKINEQAYTRVVIDDPLIEQYHIDELAESDYVFEVAAFDEDGLYSDFVTAER